MIDMGSIGAVLSSLNAAKEIAKGMVNLHTTAEVQAATIDLNGKIIEAQQQLFAVNQTQTSLAEEVRELKGQIACMKNWDAEKQRYKLATPHTGAMVYALKKGMSDGEPPHYLCASCFKKGQPSILQIALNKDQWSYWGCPICKSQAITGYCGPDQAQYLEDIVTR